MGAPPPTRTAPMDTCTEERRVMFMGNAWAALTGAAIIRKPESVCSERVRRKPERRRRKFRPETLRHRNGRRRQAQPPRGFWRAVDPHCFHPPKGSGARGRLISQVTGQKGGRRLSRRRCACRLFRLEVLWEDRPRFSSCTRSWARASWTSAAGVEATERTDLAMLAIQGPEGRAKAAQLLSAADAGAALALPTFVGREIGGWFVARTGYTGEDGFEIMMPAADAVPAWRRLNSFGVASCGLGARDTLRLEAGMNLYGNDMDESTQPFESGLGWTVAMEPRERAFIGREALEPIARGGSPRQLVGLLLTDRGVLRSHQRVLIPGGGEGEITSGTFSPTLERSIAFARIPAGAGAAVQVDVRGKLLNARVVKLPFVRFGKSLVS